MFGNQQSSNSLLLDFMKGGGSNKGLKPEDLHKEKAKL